ncbi:hypothetical protein WJX72_005720 [[Myrmecia] bisecta]|uniref:Enoyl reductase (ER) domain-containing protein n=1 Tax=[Myrmecia] bisecta TaxID=41462 RepID=A0AAW1Q7U6_9CHLO
MRAVVLTEFGAPSVLKLVADQPIPQRSAGEALVRVAATSVNPVDTAVRAGKVLPLLVKRPQIVGGDLSGVVVETDSTSQFKPGDKVFALTDGFNFQTRTGTYAEFASMKEDWLAPLPDNHSIESLAGVPLVALTAWQALEPAHLKAGQRVLIHAGAGGVGSMAIQIAKAWGLWVATTCGPKNIDLVTKELGADQVIDYTKEDFTQVLRNNPVDCVLDMLGGTITGKSKQVLRRGGYLAHVLNANSPYLTIGAGLVFSTLRLGVRTGTTLVKPNGKQLRQIGDLIQRGKIKPVVDRVLPLEQAGEGHAVVESGHARGKVILKVQDV